MYAHIIHMTCVCVCVSHSVISNSLRPLGLSPTRLLRPWNSPGKNTGVGCLSLLQGIFLTQGLNRGLLHCRQILYHLSHQGSPIIHILYINSVINSTTIYWAPTRCQALAKPLCLQHCMKTVTNHSLSDLSLFFYWIFTRVIVRCEIFLVIPIWYNRPEI